MSAHPDQQTLQQNTCTRRVSYSPLREVRDVRVSVSNTIASCVTWVKSHVTRLSLRVRRHCPVFHFPCAARTRVCDVFVETCAARAATIMDDFRNVRVSVSDIIVSCVTCVTSHVVRLSLRVRRRCPAFHSAFVSHANEFMMRLLKPAPQGQQLL